MQNNILQVTGSNADRIERLMRTQASVHYTQPIQSLSDEGILYSVWVSDALPPYNTKIWYRSYSHTLVWDEIVQARSDRHQYNLDYVVVHQVPGTPDSSTLNICIGRDGVVRVFVSERDVDLFTLESIALRGE